MTHYPNSISKLQLGQVQYPGDENMTWFLPQTKVDEVIAAGNIPEIELPMETVVGAPKIALLLTRDKHPDRELPDYSLPQATVDALVLSGGKPCVMCYEKFEEQLEKINPDGIYLPGGDFALPKDWSIGGQVHSASELRALAYIKLLDYAKKHKLPLLGVCAGMQMLAGYCGAKLQKVEGHRTELKSFVHEVSLSDNSWLREITGSDKMQLNSHHHLAVRRENCGDNDVVCTDDGVVEFICPTNKWHKFVLGVQSHPEYFVKKGYSPAANLFKAFVEACKNG